MLLTAVAQQAEPDFVALAMVIALAAVVAGMALQKVRKNRLLSAAAPAVPVPPERPVAPGCAGQFKLNDVDPKTAAMAMAIVADKLGKPLNELRFLSIKEVTKP